MKNETQMKQIKLIFQNFDVIKLLRDAKVPIGGAAIELYAWMNAFNEIGCDVGLLTFKGTSDLVKNSTKFELIESYKLEKGIPKIRLLTYRIPSYYKAVKRYNPDFIIQECANENTGYFAIISKLLGKKFIHRIGSDMDVDGRIDKSFSKISQLIYYWGIKNADHISCQNKYQYSILKKKYPNKSISILHNPYFYLENKIMKKGERSYIAWIGNFRYEKNLPALANIAERFPDLQFKIAGTRFPITDNDSEKGIARLKQMKNVEFLGHINNSEVSGLLSQAICLLNTSRLEGFSNTFLEAWSVGTPVITTANVNPDRIISDYGVGLVAEKYDKLPDKINEVISYTDEHYDVLSKRCVEYVKEEHDPIKLARIFLEDMLKTKNN
jgi:glycosyltransferase involved in cell wall biosynthesis